MAYSNGNSPLGLVPAYALTATTWSQQLRPYKLKSGFTNAGGGTVYNGIFEGDLVTMYQGYIISWRLYNTIATALSTSAPIGVFQGVVYTDANGNPQTQNYWLNGTTTLNSRDVQVKVLDDPNTIFTVQTSTSSTTSTPNVLAVGANQANVGCNIGFNYTTTGGFAAITGPGGTYTVLDNPGAGTATNGGTSGFYADLNTITNAAPASSTDIAAVLKIIALDEFPVNATQQPYAAGPPKVGPFNNVLVIINNHLYKGGLGTIGVGNTTVTG